MCVACRVYVLSNERTVSHSCVCFTSLIDIVLIFYIFLFSQMVDTGTGCAIRHTVHRKIVVIFHGIYVSHSWMRYIARNHENVIRFFRCCHILFETDQITSSHFEWTNDHIKLFVSSNKYNICIYFFLPKLWRKLLLSAVSFSMRI